MSDVVITVKDLGKRYTLSHQAKGPGDRFRYRRFSDVLLNAMKATFRRTSAGESSRPTREEFWALRDVSFEVKRGDVVGIIGRNGAGKSTLLKVLSRITEPSTGRIEIEGRVASLLEVGTWFHPELTGRENIYLNGAILGMNRAEIRAKFDEIVAFAEVERFLDTPVKHYSSGMYVRLAFAVAAHLEPQILIVDEVLAVGDAAFQAKCLGKIQDVANNDGRTVLFVSHNLEAMSMLTRWAIMLARGRTVNIGPTREIIAQYLSSGSNATLVYTNDERGQGPVITRVELRTSGSNNIQQHGEPMAIDIAFSIPFPINGTRFEIIACDDRLQRVSHLWLYDGHQMPVFRESGEFQLTCHLPKAHLYQGKYTLLLHLAERSGGRLFQKLEGICPFEVIMSSNRDGGWQVDKGTYIEDAEWSLKRTGECRLQ